jgi:acyl carrier protein
MSVLDADAIFERLQAHLAELLELPPEDITLNAKMVDDLDADSLDLLDLILSLKGEFGITVADGEVKLLLTQLARFLPERIGTGDELTDEELAEVSRRLTVQNLVQFIEDRTTAPAS